MPIKRIYHKPFEGRTHTDFHFTGKQSIKHDAREAHTQEMAELLYKVEYTGRKIIREK